MALDYLAQNALMRYPFKDTTSLTDNSGVFSFPNDFFLDIILVAKQQDTQGAYLYSFQNRHTAATLTFKFKTLPEEHLITVDAPYTSITDKGLVVFADEAVAIKIVPGTACVKSLESTDETIYVFSSATAALAPSAVIRMGPRVTSLAFLNWDKDTNAPISTSELVFSGDETHSLDNLTLAGGFNTTFMFTDGVMACDVIRGSGAGLYDTCEDEGSAIRTINYIQPAAVGNFLFETDDCYTTIHHEFGLYLVNSCKPKCSAEQITGFAHYNNRIIDAETTLFTYAGQIYQDIKNEIDRYRTEVVPTLNQPYYKVAVQRSASIVAGKGYLTIGIGFFNPTAASITYSFVSDGVQARNSTGELSQSAAVPCLSHSIASFTVFGDLTSTILVSGTFGALAVNITETI